MNNKNYCGSYELESHLVFDLINWLKNDSDVFPTLKVLCEFYFRRGRVDVIGTIERKMLYSFEAKLFDWKKALFQARKYATFSHHAYVVMPKSIMDRVSKFKDKFDEAGVGLCFLGSDGLTKVINSPVNEPLEPWLTEEALGNLADYYG